MIEQDLAIKIARERAAINGWAFAEPWKSSYAGVGLVASIVMRLKAMLGNAEPKLALC
jgi:hypothetical protein